MYCDIAEGMQKNAGSEISDLLEKHKIGLPIFKIYCSMLSAIKRTFIIEDMQADEYRFIELIEKAFNRLYSTLLES